MTDWYYETKDAIVALQEAERRVKRLTKHYEDCVQHITKAQFKELAIETGYLEEE